MRHYVILGLLLLAAAAQAQIVPSSPARQRAADRQALRETRRATAPYKASHLDVTGQQLRRGGSTAPARPADEPRFGRNGQPRPTLAQRLGLRHRASEPQH